MVNKTSKSKSSTKSTKTTKFPTKKSTPKSTNTPRTHKTSHNFPPLSPATRVILTFILLALAVLAGFAFVLSIPATILSTDVSGLAVFANLIALILLAAICTISLILSFCFYKNRPFHRTMPIILAACCLALVICIFLTNFSLVFSLSKQ